MGNRLGINSAFPREEIIKQTDNKAYNNIKAVAINNNAGDKVDLSTSKSSNNVKFTGGSQSLADGFSRVMEKVELGGFMAEFLLVDFFGMMIPRTYQAFMRNREELGDYNYKAGSEEAIREFLTGPSMTLLPMVGLVAAKKLYGSGTQIGMDTLNKFEHTMNDVHAANPSAKTSQDLRNAFYKNIFDEITIPHRNHPKFDASKFNEFKGYLVKIGDAQNAIATEKYRYKLDYGFKTIISKPIQLVKRINDPFYEYKGLTSTEHYKNNKIIAEEKGKLVELFSNMNKACGVSPENSHKIKLLTPEAAKLSPEEMKKAFNDKTLSISKSVSDLATDLINYTKGIVNEIPAKMSKEKSFEGALSSLQSRARGGRKLSIASTVVAISAILYYIPVLYKRNKQFPGIDGLVDEKTPAHATNLSDEQGGR